MEYEKMHARFVPPPQTPLNTFFFCKNLAFFIRDHKIPELHIPFVKIFFPHSPLAGYVPVNRRYFLENTDISADGYR